MDKNKIYYDALLNRDSSFEGIFIAGVKTTGIFCRPTCTARKPKPENVEFFSNAKEAMASGYRPCKICNPLVKPDETPAYISEILNELAENPLLKIKDTDLEQRGIEPSKLRRWFLKHHGVTFHTYQRMLRINSAFKKIKQGGQVTMAAYDSGYDSLSGFGDSFKNIFGTSPANSKNQTVIDLARVETPLGPMFAAATGQGICLLEFGDRKMLQSQFDTLAKQLDAVVVQGENKHFGLLRKELADYFDGKLKEFTVPLHPVGTVFQQQVWEVLRKIPYGTTTTYRQQSEILGKPKAVRAVANANGLNKIAIIIPCHRIIGSDGNLRGYAGGLHRKQWLLDMERTHN